MSSTGLTDPSYRIYEVSGVTYNKNTSFQSLNLSIPNECVRCPGTVEGLLSNNLTRYKAERVEQSKNIQQLREEIERAQENLVKVLIHCNC